ncbi:hypothetical protein [Bradyrhizobium sacchari]|uniref:Uncharacterized protein n=1 Tax=Bradyrhizobium sacchari TaxID=1399419 RepID=A0A560IRJ1_9BRAD|nr:hypothetical protein [Bradyrhizobium sacchari]TWB59230.1 hypothetical protein FBZ94_105506 [Bradyrhizobium sacchari]TWB72410.1 hypothetical protein FBZ95_106125 [Bradyrhizobium sacchari]
MPHCESLQPEERDNRRSIADAVDLLHQHAAFDGGHTVKIRIGGLRLPSQDIVGLVAVCAENAAAETSFIVTLPTCKKIRARSHSREDLEEFDIFQFGGATVHGNGNVELVDGTRLRAVDVIPVLLPYNLTELDWVILRRTIEMKGAEQECYTYSIPFDRPVKAFDCRNLPLRGTAPPVKEILRYIAKREPTLKRLSRQKVDETLRKFGMWRPRTRRLQSVAAG